MQKSFQQLGQIWWVLGLSDHTSHMWSTVQRGRPAVARYDRVSVIGRPADIYMLTSPNLTKKKSLISRSYLFTRHVKPNNDRGKEIPEPCYVPKSRCLTGRVNYGQVKTNPSFQPLASWRNSPQCQSPDFLRGKIQIQNSTYSHRQKISSNQCHWNEVGALFIHL